jgi:hypothetical protein
VSRCSGRSGSRRSTSPQLPELGSGHIH